MRRKIMISTTFLVLIVAGVAYAATNSYTASFSFSPNGAGSAAHPKSLGYTETLTAKNNTKGSRAAPLTDILTKIYGLTAKDDGAFPTCDGNQISARKSDSFCPKKALVAQGSVNALLGGPVLSAPGVACNPGLDVWNGGHGTLWFFFTTSATHQCGTLHTGDTRAYPGHVKQQGKWLVTDVPLPSYVSTAVAGHNGLYGSLIKEVLVFKNLTTKSKGKTVGFNESIACKGHSRPWSVTFTAYNGHGSESSTVTGSAGC